MDVVGLRLDGLSPADPSSDALLSRNRRKGVTYRRRVDLGALLHGVDPRSNSPVALALPPAESLFPLSIVGCGGLRAIVSVVVGLHRPWVEGAVMREKEEKTRLALLTLFAHPLPRVAQEAKAGIVGFSWTPAA